MEFESSVNGYSKNEKGEKHECLVVSAHLDLPAIWRYTNNGEMQGGFVTFVMEPTEETQWLMVYDKPSGAFSTIIPKERRILFITEPREYVEYNADYLEQFGVIFSPYELPDYDGRCIVTNACLGWWTGSVCDKGLPCFSSLRDTENFSAPVKTKVISAINSASSSFSGHKKRLGFICKLMDYFKERIDFYGRGIHPVNDKLQAILDYKYIIAIENSSSKYYWTEKLTDVWVGWGIPIYYGDPSILDQLPNSKGIEVLSSIDDFDAAISRIETILKVNDYDSRLDAIKECRTWAIKNGNPFEKASWFIKTVSLPAMRLLSQPQIIHKRKERFYPKSIFYFMVRTILGDRFASILYQTYKAIQRR